MRPLPFCPLTGTRDAQWASRTSSSSSNRVTGPTLQANSIKSPAQPGGPQSLCVAPPKRPAASTWGQCPISSAPSHTAASTVEITDLEQPEPQTWEGEPQQAEVEVRPMASAPDVGRLRAAYHALFSDGVVPAGKLPELLTAAGLTTSSEQVEEAVIALHPEVSATGHLRYDQCQGVFLRLQQQLQPPQEDHGEEPAIGTGRLAHWLAMLSDRDSANLLLAVVITLTVIATLLEGGLAILLLSVDDTSTVKGNLQENLGVVQDSLDVYGSQIAIREMNDRATMFVATMSSMLQNVAFASAVRANAAQLSRVLISVTAGLSAWLAFQNQPAFIGLATVTAGLANASAAQFGRNATGGIVDEMNARLPDGLELLLGQWRVNSTSVVQYLTQFQYAGQVPGAAGATAPMKAALAGSTSACWGVDYSGAAVYTGYCSANGLGVQVNILNTTLIFARIQQALVYLNTWTIDPRNSWEYMLAYVPSPGVRVMASTLSGCDAACQAGIVADGMPLARALNGETGTTTYINFRGVKSVVSFAPIPNAAIPMGLAVHMAYSDIVVRVLAAATSLINNLNTNLPSGSEEFELVRFAPQGTSTNFTRLSAYRFADECPAGQCVPVPEYVRQAALNCSADVSFSQSTDYRGKAVFVSSTCTADLGIVFSFKVDQDDLDASTLSAITEAVNKRNAADSQDTLEFLVAKPKAGLTAAQATGYGDFDVVTQLKYPNQCATPNCTWNRVDALRALQGLTDVIEVRDYRDVDVLAAPSRSDAVSYGLGLAVEQDHSDAFQPTVDTIIRVATFTGGAVVVGVAVLVAIMWHFLRSMIRARVEGQRVLVAERERFSTLVSAMYPPYVVPQLLEGQRQLVCDVPGAAVFFSDIHEFTSASNTMGSKELLQLMGYVYGVMDQIGDRFGVFKVKTIGDAYLAVQGLPGCKSENPSLDLLRYASFVCQVFGDRFVHPTEGQVLAAMNSAMLWNGGVNRWKRGSRSQKDKDGAESGSRSSKVPSVPRSQPSKHSQRTSVVTGAAGSESGEPRVQCVMSYGLAVGRVVAGVLGGHRPAFDIWGGTVNLASRMQSTGEPGRIQVSEQLYQKVVAVPGQPFTFDPPRSTVCKGFGSANAYLVRGTSEGLPKDLQARLRLEPRYGAFMFDNILASGPTDPTADRARPAPPHKFGAAASAPLQVESEED
eukprot:EG_transcript_225